jgi:hypothetical protein
VPQKISTAGHVGGAAALRAGVAGMKISRITSGTPLWSLVIREIFIPASARSAAPPTFRNRSKRLTRFSSCRRVVVSSCIRPKAA